MSDHAVTMRLPAPGSPLASRIDARRRAGLGDPDWTLPPRARAALIERREAAKEVRSRSGVGIGKPTETPQQREWVKVVLDAGVDPRDLPGLDRLVSDTDRALNGDAPKKKAMDSISVCDPATGRPLVGKAIGLGLIALVVAAIVSPGSQPGVAIVLFLLLLAGVAGVTVVSNRNGLRLADRDLEANSNQLVTVHFEGAQAEPATSLINAVDYCLRSPAWRGMHSVSDAVDLMAERDRLLVVRNELDHRAARLATIARDLGETNRADVENLRAEVDGQRASADRAVTALLEHAGAARAADDQAASEERRRQAVEEMERRRRAALAELDHLATPPPEALSGEGVSLYSRFDPRAQG